MKELTFFDQSGKAVAYLASSEENTVYAWSGVPLAYIDADSHIYGFNGRHLGWFEDGILWDHSGERVGYTRDTLRAFAQFEPFKGFKQFRPFRAFKQFAPFKPFKSLAASSVTLQHFLDAGR